MVLFIDCLVFSWILFLVSIVVDGLMKSVSLCICLVIPTGSVPVDNALSMISLWCIA